MCQSLWPQLRLKADSEEELIQKYRDVYHSTYVWNDNGERRVFTDWNGSEYIFSERAFDHAFTTSTNYRLNAGIHDGGFCRKRLRRILWIKEVLSLSAGTIQRFTQQRRTDRGRNAKRRTLVVVEERYVVVFDDPRSAGQPFQFVTAFPADRSYIERIKQSSFLAETKKGCV